MVDFVKKTIDFDDKLKNSYKKVTLNKVKDELTRNELNKLSEKFERKSRTGLTKGLIDKYSINSSGKYSGENISQNYLVFSRYFTSKIGSWESKGISEEIITPPSTTGNRFDLEITCNYAKEKIKSKGI